METLKELLDQIKLDFTKTVLLPSGGSGTDQEHFDISSREFLRFSKEDFEQDSLRGFVNAISNSKRAIDCKIDETLKTFGIDVESNSDVIKLFIDNFTIDEHIPLKLRLIQSLNLAPSFLISNVRGIRNRLEHDYEKPTKREAKEAIEIAELFLKSVNGITRMHENELMITDKENFSGEWSFKEGFSIGFESVTKSFDLSYTPVV